MFVRAGIMLVIRSEICYCRTGVVLSLPPRYPSREHINARWYCRVVYNIIHPMINSKAGIRIIQWLCWLWVPRAQYRVEDKCSNLVLVQIATLKQNYSLSPADQCAVSSYLVFSAGGQSRACYRRTRSTCTGQRPPCWCPAPGDSYLQSQPPLCTYCSPQ